MGEPSTFGRFLRERRKLLDMTQEALADTAGYSVSTIRKLELGVLRPSRNLIERLADVLQLEPGEQADMVWRARMLPAGASGEPATQRARGNIPASPTALLGRDAELTHLVTLVLRPDVRLATVTGPGGAGKTRLAVEAAQHVRGAFPDGVWWVDLAPIPDASLSSAPLLGRWGWSRSGVRSRFTLCCASNRRSCSWITSSMFRRPPGWLPSCCPWLQA